MVVIAYSMMRMKNVENEKNISQQFKQIMSLWWKVFFGDIIVIVLLCLFGLGESTITIIMMCILGIIICALPAIFITSFVYGVCVFDYLDED